MFKNMSDKECSDRLFEDDKNMSDIKVSDNFKNISDKEFFEQITGGRCYVRLRGSSALDRSGAEGQGADQDGWTQGGVLCRPPQAQGQDPDQERAADAAQGPDPIAACLGERTGP